MTTRSQERLADLLADLDRRVSAAGRSGQLGNSSFLGGPGQAIDVLDPATGNPVASYGTQFDGTTGAVNLSGPTPPEPSQPTATGDWVRIKVTWDGVFKNHWGGADPTVPAPLDFSRVEVHASIDPLFTGEFAGTLKGSFESPRGGEVNFFAPAGTWYVRLVTRSIPGKASTITPAIAVQSLPLDVNEEFQQAVIARMAIYLSNTDGSGYTSTVTGQGLSVTYTADDGSVQNVILLGTFGEDLISLFKNGAPTITMSSDGVVAARGLEAGESLMYRGEELQTKLNDAAVGVYNWGEVDYGTFNGASMLKIGSNSYYGIASVDYITTGNRMTRIIFRTPTMAFSEDGGEAQYHFKFRITAANDTSPISEANSSTFEGYIVQNPGANKWHEHIFTVYRPIGMIDAGKRVQILVMAWRGAAGATGYFKLFNRGKIVVDDAGPLPINAGIVKNSGGGRQYTGDVAAPAPPAPPPTASTTTRTDEWGFNDVYSYLGNNAYYAYNFGKGYQGLQPYTNNGNLKSMWRFPDLLPWIGGSTINKIEAFFHFEHWNYGSGGTAHIYGHGYQSLPNSYPPGDLYSTASSGGWPINSGRWVTLNPAHYHLWASGATRGLALVGDGSYEAYGIASNSRLRITYTK